MVGFVQPARVNEVQPLHRIFPAVGHPSQVVQPLRQIVQIALGFLVAHEADQVAAFGHRAENLGHGSRVAVVVGESGGRRGGSGHSHRDCLLPVC